MLLHITRQMKTVGVAVPLHLTHTMEPLDANGEVLTFISPVSLNGDCEYSGSVYYIRGNLSVRYETVCCRCLRPVTADLAIPVEEEFSEQEDEEHPDRYLFTGETLDLTKMITDQILLNVPMRHLCDTQCKGLCPVCGKDRNQTDCGCIQPGRENPFAALKDFFNEEV